MGLLCVLVVKVTACCATGGELCNLKRTGAANQFGDQ